MKIYDDKPIQKITNKFIIRYKRFNKQLPALFKDNDGNAGYDLFARLDAPLYLNPGETALIPLNVATEIPPNAVGLVFQRSSTYRKWGIKLTNGVGVIDSSYRGDNDEWMAEFKNETDRQVVIHNGDKICQAVFLPLLPVELVEVDCLNNPNRGGFGTTFDNVKEIK